VIWKLDDVSVSVGYVTRQLKGNGIVISFWTMPNGVFDWLSKHRAALWVIVPVIALDIWFDYYHRGGIVLDVIILLALAIRYGSRREES